VLPCALCPFRAVHPFPFLNRTHDFFTAPFHQPHCTSSRSPPWTLFALTLVLPVPDHACFLLFPPRGARRSFFQQSKVRVVRPLLEWHRHFFHIVTLCPGSVFKRDIPLVGVLRPPAPLSFFFFFPGTPLEVVRLQRTIRLLPAPTVTSY